MHALYLQSCLSIAVVVPHTEHRMFENVWLRVLQLNDGLGQAAALVQRFRGIANYLLHFFVS